MPATRARSSLRRSVPHVGVVAIVCFFGAATAADVATATTPAPDPPPAAVRPDPPPEATQPPAATTAPPQAASAPRITAPTQPARSAPAARSQQPRARKQAPRPQAKPTPKRRVVVTPAAVHDSAPMPVVPVSVVATEPLDRRLLTAAGLALLVVALGGGIALVAGSRALAGARA